MKVKKNERLGLFSGVRVLIKAIFIARFSAFCNIKCEIWKELTEITLSVTSVNDSGLISAAFRTYCDFQGKAFFITFSLYQSSGDILAESKDVSWTLLFFVRLNIVQKLMIKPFINSQYLSSTWSLKQIFQILPSTSRHQCNLHWKTADRIVKRTKKLI